MAVVPSGKPAISRYRILRRFRHFSHLEVSLESGRTHQIRVHLSHIGFPLVGDPVYAGTACRRAGTERGFERQALHAWRLRLQHPAGGEKREYRAPVPADYEQLVRQLSEP